MTTAYGIRFRAYSITTGRQGLFFAGVLAANRADAVIKLSEMFQFVTVERIHVVSENVTGPILSRKICFWENLQDFD